MIELQVLTVRRKTINSRGIVEPLWRARRLLRDQNVALKKEAYTIATAREADVLVIDSKVFKNKWEQHREQVFEQLSTLKNNNNKLIWFDSGDSTGNIISDVFGHVDLYLKSQLLKDKEKYRQAHYGGRIFTDFFNREHGITDSEEMFSSSLGNNELARLKLGWNYGLTQGFGVLEGKFTKYLSIVSSSHMMRQKNAYCVPDDMRPNLASMRISTEYTRETIKIQRRIASEKARRLSLSLGWLAKRDYLKELQNSKAIISPFGWGEIAIRDFECFAVGSTLVKPDMEHLNTFPPYYDSGITYLPIQWDIGDLDDVINLLVTNPREGLEIAKRGQEKLRYYSESERGHEDFVSHLMAILYSLEAA